MNFRNLRNIFRRIEKILNESSKICKICVNYLLRLLRNLIWIFDKNFASRNFEL